MFDPIGIIQISAWSHTVTTVGQKKTANIPRL